MSRYSGVPFVPAKSYGGARNQTQLIVMHATANTASAEAEAAYMSRRTDGVSVHFFSDSDSSIQVVDTALVAFGCFPTGNSRSVQFELCGLNNQISDATMRQAAPLVARACAEFGVPIRKVGPVEMRTGMRGICGHGDVTLAWHEGDHTDPGAAFPWDRFITYVQAAAGIGGSTEGDEMPNGMGPIALPRTPQGHESYSIWPVNQGSAGFGPAWLSIFGDFFGGKAAVRLAISDGAPLGGNPKWQVVAEKLIIESGKSFNYILPTGTRGLSVIRVPVDANDPCTASLSASIEYGKRA